MWWKRSIPRSARRLRSRLRRARHGCPDLLEPYRRERIHLKRWDRPYDCELYRPHVLAEAIVDLFPDRTNRYAVNLGAGDGVDMHDPVFPLYASGWGGLAVEGANEPRLLENLPDPSIHKRIGVFVDPGNVATLLADANCPVDCDFFKIDVDGYDGPILEAVLEAGFRPKIIQFEVQPEFPPPIEFSVRYDPGYRTLDDEGKICGFYGASLAWVVARTRPAGYLPAMLDFVTPMTHDVTLIHEDFRDVAVAILGRDVLDLSLRERYLAHPPGFPHLLRDCGIDSPSWRYRTDWAELLVDIRRACDAANVRKHPDGSIPYDLALGPRSA